MTTKARGFMFSYEKLLGAKALTNTDEKNRLEGKDTSVDRTRRLFYVTCSRAQRSLAVIVYTKEADKVASHMSSVGCSRTKKWSECEAHSIHTA